MDVQLYLFHNIESFSETHLDEALQKVSAKRREKALAYAPVLNRKLSVTAELLLRYAWRRNRARASFPDIEILSGGKPYFAGVPPFHFNLSHCKTAVACAVAGTPVGVDVESYRSIHESLLRKVLNEQEREDTGNNPIRFAEWWTQKESCVKYTGQGITDNLPDLLKRTQDVFFKTFHSKKGYACSVCYGEPLPELSPVYVEIDELLSLV